MDKTFVDTCLLVVMGALVITGAWGGFAHLVLSGLLALFLIAHAKQHRTWFKALGRGRWTPKRKLRTVAVAVPTALVVACCLTGFLLPNAFPTAFFWAGGVLPTWNDPQAFGAVFQRHHVMGFVAFGLIALHVLYLEKQRSGRTRPR